MTHCGPFEPTHSGILWLGTSEFLSEVWGQKFHLSNPWAIMAMPKPQGQEIHWTLAMVSHYNVTKSSQQKLQIVQANGTSLSASICLQSILILVCSGFQRMKTTMWSEFKNRCQLMPAGHKHAGNLQYQRGKWNPIQKALARRQVMYFSVSKTETIVH